MRNILSFVSVQMLAQTVFLNTGVLFIEKQCSDECDWVTIWDKEHEK